MLLVTTETVSGRELEMLGLVKGSTIQSKNCLLYTSDAADDGIPV